MHSREVEHSPPQSAIGQVVPHAPRNETISYPAAVLRLQATIGNRATSRLLARRELPDTLGSWVDTNPANWTALDRQKNSDRWKQACEHNLLRLRHGEYTRIVERRDFYRWFYEATADKGFETRWALAAYIVAGGMAEMAEVDWTEGVSPITNELQGLTRIGNQVIFDDVLPKLRKLYVGAPLKGAAARRSDELILAEEQNLIQNLYTGVSTDTMERFAGMADMTYWRAQFGAWIGLGGSVKWGRHHKGGAVATFGSLVPGGDIGTPADRWRYGMALAQKMSTLPDYGPVDAMPPVGAAYSSATQFDQLNVRPHLHMIDAMINDIDIPEGALIRQLKALTPSEQREGFASSWRVGRIGKTLSYAEMRKAIGALPHMRIATKLGLLGLALVRTWSSVDYDEIQPMIALAAKHHPEDLKQLHNYRWQQVFLDICDDDTIDQAVSDIGLPPAQATAWAKEEKSLF